LARSGPEALDAQDRAAAGTGAPGRGPRRSRSAAADDVSRNAGRPDRASLRALRTRGLGPAKAASLKAAFELGRWLVAAMAARARVASSRMSPPLHALPFNLPREVFIAVLLNAQRIDS
jgi:hypothetical protein